MQRLNSFFIRSFSKQHPSNLKGKKKSSQDWLIRQFRDPYVEKANKENYRCRSSYKLIEINQKHRILNYGACVLDIGCAPGSWSQVCVKAVNSDGLDKDRPKGLVIGIDKLQMYHLDGITFFGNTDFNSKEAQEKIQTTLGDRKVNCILSDMAPNATGIRSLDQEGIMELAESVFNFAKIVSADNASMLIKVWSNGELSKFIDKIKDSYETTRYIKPDASRSDSAELYILAKGYKTIK